LTADAQSFLERPPVKVNTVFHFRVEVKVGPDIKRPTAPWYAYFPADPRMSPSLQSSPYPPWPQQFPPPRPPSDAKDVPQLQKQSAQNVPSRPMLTTHWPSSQTLGSPFQPVGYVPSQVPAYWHQTR
jgi:hypothetical protein